MKAVDRQVSDTMLLRPQETIANHASSFAFAASLIEKEYREPIQQLYALCRYVDDIADEAPEGQIDSAKTALSSLQADVRNGHAHSAAAALFRQLEQDYNLSKTAFLSLIDGVSSDLQKVEIDSERDLMAYCYQVAGTVGEMMCDIFAIDNAQARQHAMQLGMAMQLTNISRDVLEDAERGRRYLPYQHVPFTAQSIATAGPEVRHCVSTYLATLLEKADALYTQASQGFAYLPFRSRFAIATAAQLYRGIGVKLGKHGCAYWQGRVYLTKPEKGIGVASVVARVPTFRL